MAVDKSIAESPTDGGVEIGSNSELRTNYPSRSLKVSEGFRPSMGFGERRSRPRPFPSLIVRGRWLERAGFDIGRRVHVEVQHGRLVIGLIPEIGKEESTHVQKDQAAGKRAAHQSYVPGVQEGLS